jgi:hypothetical protein
MYSRPGQVALEIPTAENAKEWFADCNKKGLSGFDIRYPNRHINVFIGDTRPMPDDGTPRLD